MTTTTPKTNRNELKAKAETFRKAAEEATPGERTALLRKARNYYQEAGYPGLAKWCERFLG